MAIDTANKKLALLHYGLPWGTPPLPSGAPLDKGDAQQLLGGYPGIPWQEVIPTGGEEEEQKVRAAGMTDASWFGLINDYWI